MKALEISELFRAAFAQDAAFAEATPAIGCYNDQSAAEFARPALVFAVTTEAMNGSGSALLFNLAISIESPAEKQSSGDPDPATAHAERVEAVRAKLLGAGRSALIEDLNDVGDFDFRGWSAMNSDPAIAGKHFVTPLNVRGPVLVL